MDIEIAYIYREESLVVSKTDMLCTHFIRDSLSEGMRITGAELQDWDKKEYSSGDRMFINKGSNDGLKEDDVFMIVGKGEKISSPITGKTLGTYYLKKSLAEIYCLYEDKAVITLKNACHGVHIKDIVIPFKEDEELVKKKVNYKKCRLPRVGVEGNVVYSSLGEGTKREIVGTGEYLTVDLGKAMVSKGDWLLFYKTYKGNLPPVIIGTGIIIDSQNTCSTAKVVDAAFPVEVGNKLVVLPDVVDKKRLEKAGPSKGEKIPIIESMEKEGAESLEINILFDINTSSINDEYKQEMKKIEEFIKDKSQFIIVLRGYSCSIGGFEYNLKLSKKRVDNVKKFLMDTFKIKEEFIESYHYGEKDAPFDNTAEIQRRQNRLVTIEVRGK
jgi:outer membrane protein OmpA-like peptidoglycan-associated protein